jgi:hypothetical protein
MKAAVSLYKEYVVNLEDLPLNDVLTQIKTGKYKTQINKIRDLVKQGKKDDAEILKNNLIAFTPSGTFKNGRSAATLDKYNQFIVIDIDDLTEAQLTHVTQFTRLAPYTYAAFVSPSGDGYKILAQVNTTSEHHKTAYCQVADYYEKALNITIDKSGKDVCRLCFVSYDQECYIKENADIFEVNLDVEPKKENTNDHLKQNLVNTITSEELFDRCLKFTEQKQSYYSGNRNNFIYLFSSNACRFGINQSDTLDFCITNFDLDTKEIKKAVSSAYKTNANEFAKFANFANSANKEEFEKQENPDIESLSLLTTTPTIPHDVLSTLPNLLREGIEVLNNEREQDVFLTGALSIVSGCLPNVSGLYSGKVVYPNLFSFLLAPAASGKGALNYSKNLADKYHKAVMAESKEAHNQYLQELSVHKHEKKYLKKGEQPPEEPKEPPFKVVFIPANTSNAKIIKHLEDNEGFGIICETEADTLGQTFKNDWGSYSDILRKAYHHEKISISRKTNNEYFEIDNPRLSVTLSGTPNQILNIIQSAEDGLFSRFIFYLFASNPVWLDPSPNSNPVNLTEHYQHLSDKVYKMVRFLNTTQTVIHLSEPQWAKFNPLFDEYLFRIFNLVSNDATSVVKRLGLIVYRLCMIFTAIRKFEQNIKHVDLQCTDQDFNNALALADVYLQHSLLVLKNLPSSATSIHFKPISLKLNFYKNLPQEFERKLAVEIGATLKIKERTVDSHLSKLEQAGYLSKNKAGYYLKSANL